MLHHALDRLTKAASTEAADLTRRRTENLAEQDRLLESHLKDALSLEQFKKYQDRLRADLDERLAEHNNDYTEARNHIDNCLDLATDIGRIYAGCNDQNRRLANQAFFTRIRIGEYKQLAKPFTVLLDPSVQQEALARDEHDDGTGGENETATLSRVSQFRTSRIECPQRGSNPRPMD